MHLALLVSMLAPQLGAEVPMDVFPDCDAAESPEDCPPDLDGDWWMISSVPESARDSVRPEELEIGSGCHADRAWRYSAGQWEVVVAVLDSGIEWDEDQLVNKVRINQGELPLPQQADGSEADSHDLDGNGLVNLQDYAQDPRVDIAAGVDEADHLLDPSDLIHAAWGADWDGVDNDGNGYVDDIAGWDFQAHDNDPYSEYTRDGFGNHGTGVMEDIGAEGDTDGDHTIGVCPNCAILPVRIGHSFITDANRVAQAVVFATDSGASVINMSIGALSHSQESAAALAWAHDNDVVISAAAGDENTFHHNFPAVADHVLYAHSIRADNMDEEGSPYSYLNFYNCNNFGPRSVISATSGGCATGATAVTSGVAGLVFSAGLENGLQLSAGEVYQLIVGSADDIWLSEEEREIAGTYPTHEAWDPFSGYGKINAARAVEKVYQGQIPPVAELTAPGWFQYHDLGSAAQVEVRGLISAERASSYAYVLELGSGWNPLSWSEVAAGQGSAPLDGVLATVDSSLLEAAAQPVAGPDTDETIQERVERVHAPAITLRLRVEDDQGRQSQLRRSFFVQRDPDLLPGFPIDLGSSGESSPVLADLDGDGVLEILVGDSAGQVQAFYGDGGVVPGFPLRSEPQLVMEDYLGSAAYQQGAVSPEGGDGLVATVAAGDLEGDGIVEVVAATMGGALYAWSEGQLRPGFPVYALGREPEEFDGDDTWDQGFWGSPALYDLDGDGALEIVAAGMDSRLYVFDGDGADWGPYPVDICHEQNCDEHGAPVVASPAVGDVDGDGDADIGLGSNETANDGSHSVTFLFDAISGSALQGWPRTAGGLVGEAQLIPIVAEGHPTSLAFADLDGDGDLEIAETVVLGRTEILHHDGELHLELDHFQDRYGASSNLDEPSMVHFCENPAFGDMTGEGVPDLVQGGVGTLFLASLPLTTAWDYQQPVGGWNGVTGELMQGWPRQIEDVQFFLAPAIADLTGDGFAEAVMSSGGYLVHAWNALGESPAGWPKLTGQWVIASPAVGDVDGDGYLDVVVATRSAQLFAWKTQGPADGLVAWASMRHDARNTGNHGTPLPQQAGPPALPEGGCCGGDDSGQGAWLLFPAWLLWRRRRLLQWASSSA